MKTIAKRLSAAAAALVIAAGSVYTGVCLTQNGTVSAAETTAASSAYKGKKPKYIFMFIGDGMSYPQIQVTQDYYSAMRDDNNNDILEANSYLNFTHFEATGSAITYDSSSFCPDSASTATSLSTGYKTYSGTINMDETYTTSYETIAEKLKDQMGYKVGIVSSVNLNHATPAAYYAHQASRNSYYEIGLELIDSDFDYFAGGGLKQADGKNGDQKNLYDLAEKNGYNVIMTQDEAEKLTAKDGKAIIIGETLADSDALSYANDRKTDEWALSDYVEKGIEVLDNDKGFFMMVEGGKIDWACHANDAGSTIADTVALGGAVNKAIEFYNQHPDETLIVVTGDHETGGLTIGYAGTNYDTFLTNLKNQKLSYAKFDSDYVAKYKENNTSFEDVMKDITRLFGLKAPAGSAEREVQKDSDEELSQAEYVLYGSYEPLSVTITHLLNNKSGVNFASYAHTGLPVGVFAQGAGSELFNGYYDNTDIYNKLAELTNVK